MNIPSPLVSTTDISKPIPMIVNGVAVQPLVSPSTRLSTVLRDTLGLTGTKIGCEAGDCGACTVLLDKQQICACITPVIRCQGRAITTVEGLAQDGQLSPLQKAFLKWGAAQCGICIPGMLMAATDLLQRHPSPTEQQVMDAIGGVLCRCTGYRNIITAILAVARGDIEYTSPPVGQAVGSRMVRLDAESKVTGRELYGADLAPPGALWLRVIRSPYAHARFQLGDMEAFRTQYPQVEAIITSADVPENSFSVFPVPKDQPVLAERETRFLGEAVLILVGANQSDLLSIPETAIPIQWQALPALKEPEEALVATGQWLHDFAPENVLCRGRVVSGDLQTAASQADFIAEGEFRTHYVEHAYIEPEAGYAEIVTENGRTRVRIFVCTQTPYMDRDEVARILRLPPEDIHIVPSAVGGGFGGKLDISIQPLLAVAAWKTKRAVRIVYTRPESMLSTTKRHPARIHARLGATAKGELCLVDFAADFNTGAYASWGSTVANRVPIHASGPYRVTAVRALTRAIYTHNAISGAFRGFGVPQSCIATETLMDDLALQIGIDPWEFRYRNALQAGQATPTGQILQASVGIGECLTALAPAWTDTLASVAQRNQSSPSHIRYGVGIACMWYGIGNTVIANPSCMTVGILPSGRFMLYNGAQEIGQGTYTIMPQIVADTLGVSIDLIDQVHGDTDLTLDAGKSSASRQTFVSGNAALFAARDLRHQLCQTLGLAPSALLRLEGSLLYGEYEGISKTLDLRHCPTDTKGNVLLGKGYFNPPTVPLDSNGQGIPYACYAFAAQIAEVRVNTQLGTVDVLHIHAAHDVGRAINRTQVEGQIHGGIAQGLGLALMEEYQAGRTDNLHDYLIPSAGDIPPITIHLIEQAEPLGPLGAKGVGEPALIATAPAILGAIRNATGARITTVPCTPSRLRQALNNI